MSRVGLNLIMILRCAIIEHLNAQIISVNETHLMYDDVIEMQNFIWYGFNRKNIHKNAPKGSGGVGFLIHNSIMLYYDVNITDMNYEGILVIKLTHKWSSFTFCIVTCYLPPENSPWGREAEAFYSHLLSYYIV